MYDSETKLDMWYTVNIQVIYFDFINFKIILLFYFIIFITVILINLTAFIVLLFLDEERYFECHYPPCTRIEQKPQEFSICSLCHVTRYCGPTCQTRDWPWHKSVCSQFPKPVLKEHYPDR